MAVEEEEAKVGTDQKLKEADEVDKKSENVSRGRQKRRQSMDDSIIESGGGSKSDISNELKRLKKAILEETKISPQPDEKSEATESLASGSKQSEPEIELTCDEPDRQ